MDLSTHVYAEWTICRIRGEIDIFTAPALREHLLAALDRPRPRVLVDLAGVTFMDASGLGILVLIQRRAAHRDGTLRLLAPTPAIRRLLKISGLSARFAVSPDPTATQNAEPVILTG